MESFLHITSNQTEKHLVKSLDNKKKPKRKNYISMFSFRLYAPRLNNLKEREFQKLTTNHQSSVSSLCSISSSESVFDF